VRDPNIISQKESDGQPLVHQMKSWILNIIAPRHKLAVDNLTQNQTPKFMMIKPRQACSREIGRRTLKSRW
jgi:hypothetical protein